jgi:thiosulfate reductase / polysulfide reductase chain A
MDQATPVTAGTTKPSTCLECSVNCGSLVTVRDGVVQDVKPNPAHPGSEGAFCIKGIKGPTGLTYDDNRLLKPLQRVGARGEGRWKEISWTEAFEEAGKQLTAVQKKYGPLSLAGATNSVAVSRGLVLALLMRSIGSPNFLINQDLCGGCRAVASKATGLDITRGEDIDGARCALVVGRNSFEADPIEWLELKKLKKRGGRIVVIDPKRTPASGLADIWMNPIPGTDAAIALAMINVIVSEGLFDRKFVDQWCHGFEALRDRVGEYTPERAEVLTSVPAADIVTAARLYADGPSTFVSGHGIDAFSAGVQTFRAFYCLLAVCGYVDVVGGNRRVKRPKGFRDFIGVLHDPAFRLPRETEENTIGAEAFPLWSGPRGWQTACHNPSVIEAILTGRPYPIRAMYISGVNIAVTYPNSRRTVDALRSLDFLMVSSDRMTPTAEFADIVLPKTTALEEDEVRLGKAHVVSITQAMISPRGEARSELEIARGLIAAMAAAGAETHNFLPWRNAEEYIKFSLGQSGITIDQLHKKGFATFDYKLGNFDESPFPSSTGKVELYSEQMASVGLDPLPSYIPPTRDKSSEEEKSAFPLVMLTGDREKTFHHSRFRDQEWAKRISPDPRILIHPLTAQELSLTNDQWVRVETPYVEGSCRLRVKISDITQPGVVSTGMGWWRPNAPGENNGLFDININAAMSYDGPKDPATGSVDTRGCRCRLVPA